MDVDPQNFFKELFQYLNDENHGMKECQRLLDTLSRNLTEEQIDSDYLDFYLVYIFHPTNGLLTFIEKSIKLKNFKKSSSKAVEILYTLVNNFPKRLSKTNIKKIYSLSTKLIRSSTDATVKSKIFSVLLICFEKINNFPETDDEVIICKELFNSVQGSVQLKHTDSVKEKELILLGACLKKYLYLFEESSRKQFQNIFLRNFQVEIAKRSWSQSVLCGFFTGFMNFCEIHPLKSDTNEDKRNIEALYSCIKKLATMRDNRIKVGNRAAFTFFANNVKLFRDKIIKDYTFWQQELLLWLKFGAEDRKVAVYTLKAYYQELGGILKERIDEECKVIVKYYVDWALEILKNKLVAGSEKHLVIVCLKQLAEASHQHLESEEFSNIFLIILQIFEETYILQTNPGDEQWEYLPDYTQTLSNFMQFKTVNSSDFFCLQRAIITMIKSFHQLSYLHYVTVIDAIVMTLFYLKQMKHFDFFVENIIYQGVVWSCSHQHITNEAFAEDIPEKIITVKNYFPLWIGILKLPFNQNYDKKNFRFEDRQYITDRIVNELIKSMMILIDKLDITINPRNDMMFITDIENAHVVEKINDYAIFLNVIDFYQEIFTHISSKSLKNSICKIIIHLINKCIQFPFVSGFYKLLTYNLKVAKDLELFNTLNECNQDIFDCYQSLVLFVSMLLKKIKDFKDELAIACLQMLLETPIIIVNDLLPQFIGPFERIFTMGRSYLPLADMGIETLQYWQNNIESENLDQVLITIIHSLDTFLRSKSLSGQMQTSTNKRRKTAQALKKRKVLLEVEPELLKIQRKILSFIGKQNLKIIQSFVFSDDALVSKSISGHSQHLKITLPYDLQLDFYVDVFIPRIVDLALHSSNRKTRTTACELLQAVTMIFLGKAKPMTETGIIDLNNILKLLAMPLLQLSCDIDQVVRQIFEPLFMQLIHWYTSPVQLRGPHLVILVDTLMEGITDSTNSNLRDFSGKCINEYIKWTIKQTTEDTLSRDPVNIKVLIRNMRYFSSYPDDMKKLGSALIFNNIYKELREENSLINIFWFEILHIFINSLTSIEYVNEFDENITVIQIKNALNHLQRVLLERANMFKNPDPKRRIPSDLKEGTLKDLAVWLMTHFDNNNRYCRESCMELFVCIAPLTGKKSLTLQAFIKENLEDTLQEKFDCALFTFPNFTTSDTNDYSILFKWLQSLLCALDGYNFIIKNNLEDIKIDENLLINQIEFFLRNLQDLEMSLALNLIKERSWTFTSSDQKLYNNLRLSCVYAIIKLYNSLIHNQILLQKIDRWWSNDFWKLICNVIFVPELLVINEVNKTRISEILTIFLGSFRAKLSKKHIENFDKHLKEYINSKEMYSKNIRDVNLEKRNMVAGLNFLHKIYINDEFNKFLEEKRRGWINKLLDHFYKEREENLIIISELPETSYNYISSILIFSLSDKGELECFIDHLHKHYFIQSVQFTEQLRFGIYIIKSFAKVIVPILINHFEEFLTLSIRRNELSVTISYINFILSHIIKEKSFKEQHRNISVFLFQQWPLFVDFFNASENDMESGLEFVKNYIGISKQHLYDIHKWLIHYIMLRNNGNLYEAFNLLICITNEEITELSIDLPNTLFVILDKLMPEDGNPNINSNILGKIMSLLPFVKSTTVFKSIIENFMKREVQIDNVTSLLSKFIINNDEIFQQKVLNIIFNMSYNESINFNHRYKLIREILPCLLHYSSLTAFEEFYMQNVNEILINLQKTNNYELNIVNFTLVELLFLRLPIGSKERENCPISAAVKQSNLRQIFLKCGLESLKVTDKSDIVRKYKCHAYNASTSIITNSKLNILYDKLFIRIINDKDILWNGIIDTTIEYKFQLYFNSIPKQRKVLVNIRDELREKRKQEKSHQKSLSYIESQRLFNSSLSEDVTNYDFTSSIIRSQAVTTAEETKQSIFTSQSDLYLDATDINNHECMGTVCGLIQHIFDTGVNELPRDDDGDDIELPIWTNGIRTTLLNPETHKNIKIFLIKVIDNMFHIFNCYSKWFIEPLLQFIVDKCAGDLINYFVTDVLILLSKWATTSKALGDREQELVSKVLCFLIEEMPIDRRDVFKYNLDIIKLIVESWKSFIKVPTDLISKLINSENKNELGVHVSSIFLVNRVAPWEDGKALQFLTMLISKFKSPKRTLYRICAETAGICLQFLNNDQYTEQVNNSLINIDRDKYICCLEGVAVHFPLIVNTYHLCKLINSLNQVPDNIKLLHLKIICRRIETSCDILDEVNDFKIVEWDCLMEDANLEIQIITLEIIKKALNVFLELKNFPKILKSLIRSVSHPNDLYRSSLYDVAMGIYDKSKAKFEEAQEVLIYGLIDAVEDNQNKVMNFWIEHSNLPDTVVKRFPYLLVKLYKPKIEDRFLGFVTYFIISLLYSNDKYDSDLFEHPLEDCDFVDYHLQTNWRLQHPSVVPMFAETLQSVNVDEAQIDSDPFVLRKTQSFMNFTPTVNTQEQQIKKFTTLESSLAVDLRDFSSAEGSFKDPNSLKLSQKYRPPRKRFLSDKSKISVEFAHYEVKKQIEQVKKRSDFAKEREKKVTIYRNYRKGDFPDIQIKLSSFLKPLQVLALQDNEISKLLFIEYFKNLASKIENNDDFLKMVKDGIKNIFTSSINFNPNLISVLLDIVLKNKNKFRFDSHLIAYVCQESNLMSVGTLLLEEYIISHDDQPTSSKKGSGSEQSQEVGYWIKLAELYKQLDEWDIVQAIFLDKMNCKEEAQYAIQYESADKWRNAQDLYEELIENDMSPERKDFYYESYFNCFAHLGQWDKLSDAINSVVHSKQDIWSDLWDSDWYQQKLLPWYITAQMRESLFTGSWSQEFFANINTCLNDEKKCEYLKGNFSEELCIMALVQRDIPLATVYLKSYIKYFLQEWQLLNPMFQTSKYQKLLKLRSFIEVDEFINIYNSNSYDGCGLQINKFVQKWQQSKEILPSVLLSEACNLYRTQYINMFVDKLKTDPNTNQQVKQLKISKILMHIDFINATAESGNYSMSKKYFNLYDTTSNPKVLIAYGNIALAKAKLSELEADKVRAYVDAVKIFTTVMEKNVNQQMSLTLKTKLFDALSRLSQLFTKFPDLLPNYQKQLNENLKMQITRPKEYELHATSLLKICFETFDEDMNVEYKEKNNSKYEEIGKAYMTLAHSLRNQQSLQNDFIMSVLRAMKMNSFEARQLFPCILLLDDLGTVFKDTFITESEKIPTWMFLGWISQLLANVESSKIFAISMIIRKIAETYPQAIMYPYRLSRECYKFNSSEIQEEMKILTDRLDEVLLKDKTVNKFLKALTYVSVPESVLRYYIYKIKKSNDLNEIKEIQNVIIDNVFGEICDSKNVEALQGNVFRNIEKYKKDFAKTDSSLNQIKTTLTKLDATLQKSLLKIKYSKVLKDYCPWLANFSGNKLNIDLEIPGQYDGEQLPLPQHHIKISGFAPEVSIMSSLRKPIKITMLGMNTKEYPFLVKFGEDIRQDQRIEQLLTLMNNIFKNDRVCANQGLNILTYQVIPLTSNLGIIQWINDTIPLYNFIEKSLSPKLKQEFIGKIADDYLKWLPRGDSNLQVHGNCIVKYNRNKTIPFYRGLMNRIPLDILKTAFWSLSTTTENFIGLRNNFIKTYAVLCISQWLLGIGDRHLNNSLICLKNGKVLGIDFGHAFGTATQILPVPELVPIRLTPHILNLMEPFKEKGQFKACMTHALRAMRNNSNSLLATMNVFIEEPSLDWLEHAARLENVNRSDLQNWYPKQKVDQAKRKFQGASSVTILIEDLRANNLQRFTEPYVAVVKGSIEHDIRVKFEDNHALTVEEQVDCLIDHAADYNLLGRMYQGWMPWI